jgi:hypothetical protein
LGTTALYLQPLCLLKKFNFFINILSYLQINLLLKDDDDEMSNGILLRQAKKCAYTVATMTK